MDCSSSMLFERELRDTLLLLFLRTDSSATLAQVGPHSAWLCWDTNYVQGQAKQLAHRLSKQ